MVIAYAFFGMGAERLGIMHPAKSVIFFTVFSGLGLGLLTVVFLSYLGGHELSERLCYMLVIALIFLTGGLLSSFLHLGHPERAWRAFSQWRSSWLSREGVMACSAYGVPLLWLVSGFLGWDMAHSFMVISALIAIFINVFTVHCTAMIYGSLRPIPAWYNFFTPMNYQLLSLMSGFVFASFFVSLWGVRPPPMGLFILVAVSLAAIGKVGYWRFLRLGGESFTINQATGISGKVLAFDPPHTSRNYLMKEMMFAWARERSRILERFVIVSAFMFPLLYGFLSFWVSGLVYVVLGGVVFVLMLLGLLVERWLFFACAEHSVSLYYGRARV